MTPRARREPSRSREQEGLLEIDDLQQRRAHFRRPNSSTRMHLTRWSSATLTGGGGSRRQASIVNGQRPANGQPLGASDAEGAAPAIPRRRSPRGAPRRGPPPPQA